MFKKMVKLKNKKAFTLIEMMAVVAIVAILVAILVPVIGNSTVKSRAATNAANLRAVEAELATLKVSKPECFVAATKTSGTNLWSMFKSGYIWFHDLVNGENSSSLDFDTVTASAGVLTFHTDNFTHTGESIDLAGVPTSVAVKADTGMDVPEGGEMVILLIDNEIRALYKGEGDKYFDKDDFAEVAETGKFTGEGTSSGGSLWDKAHCDSKDSTLGFHKWKVEGTKHVCEHCGASFTHEDNLGRVSLENGIKDGKCDYCDATCGTANSGIAHVYNSKGVCTKCGATNASHVHVDKCGDWGSPDGKCDDCNATCGTANSGIAHVWNNGVCKQCGIKIEEYDKNHKHSWNVDGNKHVCAVCDTTHSPNWTAVATAEMCRKCTVCGLEDKEHNYQGTAGYNDKVCKDCGYIKPHNYESMRFGNECKHCGQSESDTCHTNSN